MESAELFLSGSDEWGVVGGEPLEHEEQLLRIAFLAVERRGSQCAEPCREARSSSCRWWST